MKKILYTFCILTQLTFGVDKKIDTQIRKSLSDTLPKLEITAIADSPVPNVYQITANHKIFYTDATGRYLFAGNLIDLPTKTNLTQNALTDATKITWNDLPLNLAIQYNTSKKPKYKIAIFTDPDCPFCKRLETNVIAKLTDVTVYYFLYPLYIHKEAKTHAKQILCSPDPVAIFTNFMREDVKLPQKSTCDNVDENINSILALGNKLGVEATPTIILENGKILTGVVPLEYLKQQITTTYSSSSRI